MYRNLLRMTEVEAFELEIFAQIVHSSIIRIVRHAVNAHCVKIRHHGFKVPNGLVDIV